MSFPGGGGFGLCSGLSHSGFIDNFPNSCKWVSATSRTLRCRTIGILENVCNNLCFLVLFYWIFDWWLQKVTPTITGGCSFLKNVSEVEQTLFNFSFEVLLFIFHSNLAIANYKFYILLMNITKFNYWLVCSEKNKVYENFSNGANDR